MEFSFEQKDYDEEENRRRGFLISLSLHLILLLLFLVPFFNQLKPQEELKGILVEFGEVEEGNGDESIKFAEVLNENSSGSSSEDEFEEATEVDSKNKNQEELKSLDEKPEIVREIPNTSLEKSVDNNAILKNVAREDLAEIKAAEKKEKEEKLKQTIEQEEFAKAEANRKELERKKAELDAKNALKEAERKKQEDAFKEQKKEYNDLFGKGKGDEVNNGDEGNPIGETDGEAITRIKKGKGKIGGGISGRGLVFEPKIEDNSQRQGLVVIKVCVNASGHVTEAKFTQRGSNTTDRNLVSKAEIAAMQYIFTESKVEKQCGTITVDFKLK